MIPEKSLSLFKSKIQEKDLNGSWVEKIKNRENTFLVCCSGGADSVFLSLFLSSIFHDKLNQLKLVHFNHGLRGGASDQDEVFCKEFASQLGIEFLSERFQVEGKVNEEKLRALRLNAIEQISEKKGISAVFFGHHGDDALEWGLMSLFRGTGPAGLCSPREIYQRKNGLYFIRPLINFSKSFIEETLKECEIVWREDSSNAENQFTRNRIRNQVIPLLKECIPQNITAGYERTRRLMQEVNEAIAVLDLPVTIESAKVLDGSKLEGSPILLWRMSLRKWSDRWGYNWGDFNANRLDQFISNWALGEKDKIELPAVDSDIDCPKFLVAESFVLTVVDSGSSGWDEIFHLELDSVLGLPNRASVTLSRKYEEKELSGIEFKKTNSDVETWFDAETINSVQIRTWRDGDRYKPLGAPGTKKLQDAFTDKKISQQKRNELPVFLTEMGEIIWVPGLPVSHNLKITNKTKLGLRLTYEPH